MHMVHESVRKFKIPSSKSFVATDTQQTIDRLDNSNGTSLSSGDETITSWRRNSKKSAAHFPIIRNDDECLAFVSEFEREASIQCVSEVLDPDPQFGTTENALKLFCHKKKYVYTILLRSIQTTSGRKVLHAVENEKDSNKI